MTRQTDGTVKMASLPVLACMCHCVSQMGQAVPSGTGRQDNGKGPFFCPLSTCQTGQRNTDTHRDGCGIYT